MGTISHRKFIRWLPDEASEPTSTLVLTSAHNRFVDIRVLLDQSGQLVTGELPIDRLDWAIAGTVSSTTKDDGQGGQIRRAKFAHWINSRSADVEGVSDEGDMYEQADGTTLEKGSMVNPDTGKDTAYEESWLDIPVPHVHGNGKDVVARLQEPDRRGMVVLLGDYCQGVARRGDDIAVERWEKNKNGEWTRTVRIGKGHLICEDLVKGDLGLDVEHMVITKEGIWEIVEV